MIKLTDEERLETEEKGKIEGKIEERIEIAKSMLDMSMDISIISKATSLSENEIRELMINK